tara:strand:+ start:692 stop:1297 length:606 start_codon:yes stop_codon:yes gene_type:complete
MSYNEKHEQANWVFYKLNQRNINGDSKRKDNFRPDPFVSSGSAELIDYKGSGYDRGHLAPAGDMKMTNNSMSESFYLSNISPQYPSFNRGGWKRLETLIRKWATSKSLNIYTAGILGNDLNSIGPNQVSIPRKFYKIIFDTSNENVIGFIMPNQKILKELRSFVVSIDEIEDSTGIDFFSEMEDYKENELESNIDLLNWDF